MTHSNLFISRGNDTAISTIASGIVFCVFSFIYLFYYQSDLLTMTQHVLSHGVTQYNRLIGAIILTALFFLIQFTVDSITKRSIKLPALTYAPSALLLAMLTDINADIDKGYSLGKWAWLAPLCVALFLFAAYLSATRPLNTSPSPGKTQLSILGNNLLTMLALMAFVCITANTDKTFHTRLRIENLISEKKYDEALSVNNSIADSSSTMLRAYALSKKGQLGDRLFEYRLCGGSDALLPNNECVKCLISSPRGIYNNVGVALRQQLRPIDYLIWIKKHGYGKSQLKDYLLCSYLMDKQLERFAQQLQEDEITDYKKLPKHYREALILYNHTRSNPLITYHDEVLEADYSDFQSIIKGHSNKKERKSLIRSAYGNTYWYYYYY